MNWREYFQKDVSLYVNARHKTLHHQQLLSDYINLFKTLNVPQDAFMLDYGCGETLTARELVQCGHALWLYDPSTHVQSMLQVLYGSENKITVMTPQALESAADASIDVMLATSVIQYLSLSEQEQMLKLAHRLLKPTGKLILADVIPPSNTMMKDTTALLRFAWQGGFLIAAILGLIRTYFSDYRRLRSTLGLTTLSENDTLTSLQHAGFNAHRHLKNIGHNQKRMTFVATPHKA
jgi:ubiquinone/menaquinone biosynthesis C-methylase UbiE